ncbi:MAG: hypothetical protein RL417_373, partial [Pseudomonadota bacterium]
MAMSHHFGPNDRDKGFSVSDLSGLTHAASAQRLSPRAEAEARFFAHIVLADLPPNSSDIEVARGRYSQFLANIFENEDGGEPDFDLDIISSCITPQRDLMLVSVRQRSTGDLILPRPDDILRLNPAQLAAHARHFEGDSFCGILFDITPQARNFLVEATPVLLPRLMRREAVRFHNGDPDSLVGELLSRFARRELGGEIRFSAALIADDEVDEGLLLLLKDPRGR